MKSIASIVILFLTVFTNVGVAAEPETTPAKTVAVCTTRANTKISKLRILNISDSYGVVAKYKNGREYPSEGTCAVRGGFGPGLYLACSIVLPGRDTGYSVKVYSPQGKQRFAWVTPWNKVGNGESLYFVCSQ